MWQYAFVQHAFLAGAITAVVAGFVGPFVTLRNMSFAVHGLAEVAFAGAAGAVMIGSSPSVGVLAASFSAAFAMGVLGVRARERDVAIGSVLAFGIGLGVLFLSLSTRYATEAFGILFGSILAVSAQDVVRSAIVGIVALLALGAVYRPLRFASVDPEVAEARGVPVRLLSTVFLLILALAVTEAVQIVGALLVLTLLVVPAGAAQRFSVNPTRIVAYSILIALVATLGGLTAAIYTSWPVSFFVAGFSFAAYVASHLIGGRRLEARWRSRPGVPSEAPVVR
jgi:zinc/manganese transport system permease protein